jgi:hypothetical protein
MLSEQEPGFPRREDWPAIILGMVLVSIFLGLIVTMIIMLLKPQEQPLPTPVQAPAIAALTATPTQFFLIRLPMISSESIPVPEQAWEVTNIENLGYELDGKRRDLATFERIGSQETVQAYCMNPGWDSPAIGAKYLLNQDGIFVPLNEIGAESLQRFSMIQ